jgi:tetratricopeptide (TPR) repeat protein
VAGPGGAIAARALGARTSIAIFGAALAVRLLHVWQMRGTPYFSALMGDSRGYDEWARRIAAGEWIGRDVFYQAPLYPYFLGVIYAVGGRHLLLVRIVQAVIGSASCVLLAMAAARLFPRSVDDVQAAEVRKRPSVGPIAGLMLALYAPAVFFDGLLQKSVLDVFFVCAALALIARTEDAKDNRARLATLFCLGVTMGALALTRENALVLIAVVLAWTLLPGRSRGSGRSGGSKPEARTRTARTRTGNSEPGTLNREPRFAGASLFLAGLALVLSPVVIRNAYVSGGLYITTAQAGPNFYIGNNPTADGTYQSLRFGRGAPEFERQDATDLAERALGRSLTPGEVSSYWTDKALDFVTSHPGAWLALMARKTALLFNATEVLDTESQEAHAEYSLPLRVLGIVGHFGVLVPLAVLGLIVTWPMRDRIWIVHALAAAYAASVVLFYVFARYRYPLVPMLILFGAAGLVELAAWITAVITGRMSRRDQADRDVDSKNAAIHLARDPSPVGRRWTAAAVAIAAVVCNWPLLSTTLMRAVTLMNLGVALQAEGHLDDAATEYEHAIALQPDYAPAYNNLGTARRAQGRLPEAVAAYQHALTLRSEYPEAHYNLANALTDEGKAREAAEHFRVALQSMAGSADVHNNLGIALMAEGRHDEAVAEFRAAVAADPAGAKAHRNLADALASSHKSDEAIREFHTAARLAPRDGAIRYDLGSLLLELDRTEEAIQEFRLSLRLNPRSAQTHNNLGIALATQRRMPDAINEFRAALALDPSLADAQRNLTMALAAPKR